MFLILRIGNINTKKFRKFLKIKIKKEGKRIPKIRKNNKKPHKIQIQVNRRSSKLSKLGDKNQFLRQENEQDKYLKQSSTRPYQRSFRR